MSDKRTLQDWLRGYADGSIGVEPVLFDEQLLQAADRLDQLDMKDAEIERLRNKMDARWHLIVAAYVRGVDWGAEWGPDELRFKAAYDYADKTLSGDE